MKKFLIIGLTALITVCTFVFASCSTRLDPGTGLNSGGGNELEEEEITGSDTENGSDKEENTGGGAGGGSNKDENSGENTQDDDKGDKPAEGEDPDKIEEDTAALLLNVKYIYEEHVRQEDAQKQTYYLFEEDGSGSYHYYYDSAGPMNISSYTIGFRYEFINENSVVCFYDSLIYDKADAGSKNDSAWLVVLTVSENFVMDFEGGGGYIATTYLDNIPNFGNKLKSVGSTA